MNLIWLYSFAYNFRIKNHLYLSKGMSQQTIPPKEYKLIILKNAEVQISRPTKETNGTEAAAALSEGHPRLVHLEVHNAGQKIQASKYHRSSDVRRQPHAQHAAQRQGL